MTFGGHSLDALEAAGAANLAGKILVDVANPLDFSRGMPPTLLFCNTESLGERIQAAFPDARVVKSLNTTNAQVMVDPRQLTEPTTMFVSGNDQEAKDWVHHELLERWFGWEHVLDLGDITAARAQEMWLPLWLRLMGATGTAAFNLRIVASDLSRGSARRVGSALQTAAHERLARRGAAGRGARELQAHRAAARDRSA